MTSPGQIPQADPRAGYRARRAELDEAWRRVMESGRYILGPEVESFEREFADYLHVPLAVATANGTDALHLALQALGVGAGDVVLTVAHTAVATAAAITQCGARPLFVDIDPATFTMDPVCLEHSIKDHRAATATRHERLKAIIPVHLYGLAADMTAIRQIADRHELAIVEDCAQSHGAGVAGRKTGSWGEAAAFSYYPTKNLGAYGDAGMVVTADESLAAWCRRAREYGWDRQRISQVVGFNSRLDELQAALLRAKLRHLDEDNTQRRALAAVYDRCFADGPVRSPAARPDYWHVYHQYVVRVTERDWLRNKLHERNVDTAIHYRLPVHRHPAYERYAAGQVLKETDQAASEILSLPIYPELTVTQVQEIGTTVNSLAEQGAVGPVEESNLP